MSWDLECAVCAEPIDHEEEEQGYCHRCRRTICESCYEKVFSGYKETKCNNVDGAQGFHGCGCCNGEVKVAIRTFVYDTKKYDKNCDKNYRDSPLVEYSEYYRANVD